MNLFELNFLASPIGGAIGGSVGAREIVGASTAVSTGLGFTVGVVLYFGVIKAGEVIAKIAGVEKPKNKKEENRLSLIMNIVIMIPMLVLPFISGVGSYWLVQSIYR